MHPLSSSCSLLLLQSPSIKVFWLVNSWRGCSAQGSAGISLLQEIPDSLRMDLSWIFAVKDSQIFITAVKSVWFLQHSLSPQSNSACMRAGKPRCPQPLADWWQSNVCAKICCRFVVTFFKDGIFAHFMTAVTHLHFDLTPISRLCYCFPSATGEQFADIWSWFSRWASNSFHTLSLSLSVLRLWIPLNFTT